MDILRDSHCPEEPKPERVKPVFIKTELKAEEKSGRKLTANAEGDSFLEEKYRLDFSVSADSMKKINRAEELLSTKYPGGMRLEALFDELLDSSPENLRLLCAKHNRLMAEST